MANHVKGVKGLTSLAKKIDSEIGSYKTHTTIVGTINFFVELSNGSIIVSEEVAQEYEVDINLITLDRIEIVAKSFKKKK